jgi:hypothetical protein
MKYLIPILLIAIQVNVFGQVEAKPYIKTFNGEKNYYDQVKFGDYNFIGINGEEKIKVSRNDVASALVNKGSAKKGIGSENDAGFNQIIKRKVKRSGKNQYEVSSGKTTYSVIIATDKALLVGAGAISGVGSYPEVFYLIEEDKAIMVRFRKEEHYKKLIEAFNMNQEVQNQFKLLFEEKGIATRMYTYINEIQQLYLSQLYIEL